MAGSTLAKNDKSLPLVFKKEQASKKTDLSYHTQEWTSGSQGGGHVPADFGWHSNPKQQQEENGSNGQG